MQCFLNLAFLLRYPVFLLSAGPQHCRASQKQESTIANHYISRLSTAVSAVSHSVLPYQHEVQDAIDRAGLDATLLREFCTLGAMVLVPWQHCPLFDGSTGSCSMRTLRL